MVLIEHSDPLDKKECDCHPSKAELKAREEYELELRAQRWLEELQKDGVQVRLIKEDY